MLQAPMPTDSRRRDGGNEPGNPQSLAKPSLKSLKRLIKKDRKDDVLEKIQGLHPAEVMALLIQLPLRSARRLYGWLPPGPAVKVLAEISPDLRAVLMAESGIARIAEIAEGLDDDDAVELLGDFPEDMVEPLLERLPRAPLLRQRLQFGEDSAGAIMSNKFVAVLDDWQIGTATRQIRKSAERVDKIYEVYVVDENRRLVGLLKLRDFLLHPKRTLVRDIMRPVPVSVHAEADQEQVLALAERYNLQTVPVVDANQRVIGRITLDELRDVVRREAEEDIKLMSGVAPDARPDESIGRLVKGRLPWLVGGLIGASIAAVVVGAFEEQLAKAAILATFIPIVMAMAGNAGIQASTVTVQGLALGNLWIGDIWRRIGKELLGSLINGVLVALLLGALILLAAQIFEIVDPLRLAVAAGLSLATVIVMAATLGATIPLVLNHFKVDPAMATGVFITTSNDIFGVLIFFVIATLVYLG